jgi:hypothetical protein
MVSGWDRKVPSGAGVLPRRPEFAFY